MVTLSRQERPIDLAAQELAFVDGLLYTLALVHASDNFRIYTPAG
jgi:hypothetical protein